VSTTANGNDVPLDNENNGKKPEVVVPSTPPADSFGEPSTNNVTIIGNITGPLPSILPENISGPVEGTYRGNGKTFTDLEIGEKGNVAGLKLKGKAKSKGKLSSVDVLADSSLEGGEITGINDNQGTITDVDLTGGNITGGEVGGTIEVTHNGVLQDLTILPEAKVDNATLSGIIDNQGILIDPIVRANGFVKGGILAGVVENRGAIHNVDLDEGARIKGSGYLAGKVKGKASHKATLESTNIANDTELSDVIIGRGIQFEGDVIFGEGVEFISNSDIPDGADLTEPLLNSESGEINQPNALDLNIDVVQAGESLAEQLDNSVEFQEWTVNSEGQLVSEMGDTRIVLLPVKLIQMSRNVSAGIMPNFEGATFITEKGRGIKAISVPQNMPAFTNELARLNIQNLVLAENGVLSARDSVGKVVGRAARTSKLTDSTDLGLSGNPVIFAFEDEDGQHEQFIYPVAAYPDELLELGITLNEDGTVVLSDGRQGVFDYQVLEASESESGETQLIDNGDNLTVIYSNGEQQVIHLLIE